MDYGRTANIEVPSLELFESKRQEGQIVAFVPESEHNAA
jgi:hypothetical protein